MFSFKFREKLSRRPNIPLLHVVEALTDTFLRTDAGGNVEKILIGGGMRHGGVELSF
jgi:hypothetical protein